MPNPTGSQPEQGKGDKLQKVLADRGLGSRRTIESWIAAGRVVVNSEIAHVGQRVHPTDKIEVDGRRLHAPAKVPSEILVMNKAAGVMCTRSDPEGRPTIYDELPTRKNGRWVSVGRLDLQTSGLILLTNDGELANKLTHPSTGLDREYAVRINRRLEEAELETLTQGIDVDGEFLGFSDIRFYDGTDNNVWYHVVLMEGKNREVRRLFEAIGASVSRLKRVRYGPVVLPSWLRNGMWASMRQEDVRQLYKLLKLRFVANKRPPAKASRVAKTSCLLPYPKLPNLETKP